MKLLVIFLTVFTFGVLSRAERVVFEKSAPKTWNNLQAQYAGFSYTHNQGILVVFIQDRNQLQPFPPEDGRRGRDLDHSYQDTYTVPGLAFDKTVGKRGAVTFTDGTSKTTCALKTFLSMKETGNCEIVIQDGYRDYKVQLIIK